MLPLATRHALRRQAACNTHELSIRQNTFICISNTNFISQFLQTNQYEYWMTHSSSDLNQNLASLTSMINEARLPRCARIDVCYLLQRLKPLKSPGETIPQVGPPCSTNTSVYLVQTQHCRFRTTLFSSSCFCEVKNN